MAISALASSHTFRVDRAVLSPRIASADRTVENAQSRPQRALRQNRENSGVSPLRVDARPVVERGDHRARGVVGRLELIAVDVPDLGAELAENRPRDQPILFELLDLDGDVIFAELRIIVQRRAVHVDHEAVTDGLYRIAFGVLEHAG